MSCRVLTATLIAPLVSIPGIAEAQAPAQTAGDFHADSHSKCKLWWPKSHLVSRTVEAVRWDGPCARGLAEGRGPFMVNEGTTAWMGEGDFVAGKLQGRAFMTADDCRREGEFQNGILDGRGYISIEGSELRQRYEGQFVNDELNGYGTSTHVFRENLTVRYEGDWVKNEASGRGIYSSVDKSQGRCGTKANGPTVFPRAVES